MALTTFIPSPWLAGLSFFLLGAGPILWVISTTTLRQSVTPPALLGRVSAINIMSYGARPLGSALGAIVGGFYGAEACLYLAAVDLRRPGAGDPGVAGGVAGAAAGHGRRAGEVLRQPADQREPTHCVGANGVRDLAPSSATRHDGFLPFCIPATAHCRLPGPALYDMHHIISGGNFPWPTRP